MVDEFINQAANADSRDFSKLIRRTTSLIKKEHEATKSMLIDGRLIRLPSSGEATIIGDIHGDLESLTHILKASDFLKKAKKHENVYLIFLGDYGDRGKASPEVYYVVLTLKKSFPDKIILMRGNHEGPEDMLPVPHDLPAQLRQKYDDEAGAKIYAELRKLFNNLYNIVLIDRRIVLIHGGAPSKASSLEDLAYAHEKHPKETHLEEMLWNDPTEELRGTKPSPRGAGKLFGIDVTRKLLRVLSTKVLIRGHEFCQDGFKTNHKGKVMTLFSSNKPPHQNKFGAYLQLNLMEEITDATQLTRYVKRFRIERSNRN